MQNRIYNKSFNFLLSATIAILLLSFAVFPQATAFSYQGRLTDMGSPVTGTRFFRFTLYDENGMAIPGAGVEQMLAVTNGVFDTSIDFGAGVFPGANRSLEIAVKTNMGDAYTVLNPRQTILSAPYSIKSKTADNSNQLGGTDAARFVQSDAMGNVAIGGNLTVSGVVSYNIVNATTQYNLGGQRILSNAGTNNLFAGVGAGTVNTGQGNAFFGSQAGLNNTSGIFNSFFGFQAGLNNTSGIENSFFGWSAGKDNITGNSNVFIGNQTGKSNVGGSLNTYVGYAVGTSNLNGNFNSIFGDRAGSRNLGTGNSFFGEGSGYSSTTGIYNSFFGLLTGQTNETGSYNTLLGFQADVGANNLTNANAIGSRAFVTSSNSIVLGAINGVNGATADTNVGIGTTAPQTRLQVSTATGNYGFTHTNGPITVGSYIGNTLSGASGGWLGTQSNHKLFFFTGNGQPAMTVDTTNNIGIGTTSPGSKLTVTGLIETTTGGVKFPDGTIQTTAGGGGSGGILNQTTLQTGANFNIDGTGSADIVNAATQYNISGYRILSTRAGTELRDIFVGYNAGINTLFSQTDNSFVGYSAGKLNSTGFNNSFFGAQSGFSNNGNQNTFVGASAGASNVSGSKNVYVGNGAGSVDDAASNNTFVGNDAGRFNANGSRNTYIGFNAQNAFGSTYTNSTAIGADSTVQQSNSMVLGSINGVANATADTSVGIGTPAPKARLDVANGNILVSAPGQGIILKSPSGTTCKLISINDAGAMVLTTVACP